MSDGQYAQSLYFFLQKSRENRLFLNEMHNIGSIILRNRVWKVY